MAGMVGQPVLSVVQTLAGLLHLAIGGIEELGYFGR